MPENGGGIDWKRTGLIVGGVAALAFVWQEPWESWSGDNEGSGISISIGDDDSDNGAVVVKNADGEIVSVGSEVDGALEGTSADLDGAASGSEAPDWDNFEAEMNRLDDRMEELEAQLEEPGADREAIEEEMGQVGRQMARTGVDAASEAIKEAIGR